MARKKAAQTIAELTSPGKTDQSTDTLRHDGAQSRERHAEVLELPLLPIRNTVLFPNVVTPLFVGRAQSIKAIEEAMRKKRTLFVAMQLDEEQEDPDPEDLYDVGVEAVIDRMLKMPDGTTSILIHGQRRLRRFENLAKKSCIYVRAEVVPDEVEYTLGLEALVRAVR